MFRSVEKSMVNDLAQIGAESIRFEKLLATNELDDKGNYKKEYVKGILYDSDLKCVILDKVELKSINSKLYLVLDNKGYFHEILNRTYKDNIFLREMSRERIDVIDDHIGANNFSDVQNARWDIEYIYEQIVKKAKERQEKLYERYMEQSRKIETIKGIKKELKERSR